MDEFRPNLFRVIRGGGSAVNHQQNPVGFMDFFPGTADTDTFHFIRRVPQAGGIDDMQGHSVDVDMFAEDVTGGAGDVSNDGRFLFRPGRSAGWIYRRLADRQ